MDKSAVTNSAFSLFLEQFPQWKKENIKSVFAESNYLSHWENEFEADAFAKEFSNGEALKSGLKKLAVDSLSNLTPHPFYVFFNYSHPPLLKRLKALE